MRVSVLLAMAVLGGCAQRADQTAERFARTSVGDWLACEWAIGPDTITRIASSSPAE
jgi:hypothetical protein